MKRMACALLTITFALTLGAGASAESHAYGVFLSVDDTQMSRVTGYDTVVIDAQYFTAEDVALLKEGGSAVYSYLNVGSLESFRPYFDDYRELCLGAYANWDGEWWVDVSSEAWQSFVVENLAQGLIDKGVDGFFVDNCDVYYQYPDKPILDGLSAILRRLVATGKDVIINGGDTFVNAYDDLNGEVGSILTGINQETVFSAIDFDADRLGTQNEADRQYYLDYIEKYGGRGAKIYLLEYTADKALEAEIAAYCEQMGFTFYVSDSIELD